MAEQRVLRGWSRKEIRDRLKALGSVPRNFTDEEMTLMSEEHGWRPECSESVIGHEPPGPPQRGGPFERACAAVADYQFSDPDIVKGHFIPRSKLEGRRMLLEIKVMGIRYLCGTVVRSVGSERDRASTRWGYRYDTLDGHLECGTEHFQVEKDHRTGDVSFCIRSWWRHGDFPNWWSRAGFTVLSPYYRKLWLDRAHERLRGYADPSTDGRRLPARTEEPPTPVTDEVSPGEAWLGAAALGALSGLRSTSGPALMAWSSGTAGVREGASRLERVMASPVTAAVVTAAALGELAADKLPGVPSRLSPPALGARMIAGALSAATMARRGRRDPWGTAAAGALAAGASAFAGYHLRDQITRRTGLDSGTVGALEDLVTMIGSAALGTTSIAPVSRQSRELQSRRALSGP